MTPPHPESPKERRLRAVHAAVFLAGCMGVFREIEDRRLFQIAGGSTAH